MNWLRGLFWCSHQRMTFPITTPGARWPHVVCLNCAREFLYSWQEMRIVKG